MKLDRAKLALSISVASIAIPREAHAHGPLAGERDETQAMSDELVVEDGGVDLDLDEVDREVGTSEIMTRRRALAMDTSVSRSSNLA